MGEYGLKCRIMDGGVIAAVLDPDILELAIDVDGESRLPVNIR